MIRGLVAWLFVGLGLYLGRLAGGCPATPLGRAPLPLCNRSSARGSFQEHITAKAWGDVWQRPGLDLKTRSLITVAMLTALGKQHELKGHLRGALNNGATPAELQEVLLHAAVYCGVPAAVDAFRTAAEVVDGPKKA